MDALLDDAPCGFVSFADDGTMLDVNGTLAALLGYTRVELRGWHLQKILPPGARVFYHTHIFPLLKLQGRAEEIYVPLRTKAGEDLPMLLNAVRRERDGKAVSDCVFVRMTQRNLFEQELLQARRVAEQASAARSKFLSMMSHDLRTPLTAISGHASLMADGAYGPITPEQHHALERMGEAGRELLRMINDILAFAQLESGRVDVRPVPVRVEDAVTRAEKLIRLRLESRRLQFDRGPADAVVHADPDRFQQILLNLLTNAIKFTDEGGRISVGAERAESRVLVHVGDTGIGIPAEQLERIFDPFVQLEQQPEDATQRGVGLGLAISRDLARAMNGDLTADSTPGRGSVFTINLPAAG